MIDFLFTPKKTFIIFFCLLFFFLLLHSGHYLVLRKKLFQMRKSIKFLMILSYIFSWNIFELGIHLYGQKYWRILKSNS